MAQRNRGPSEFGRLAVGAFTVVGTAQQFLFVPPVGTDSANFARSYLRVVNLSTTGTIWLTKSPTIGLSVAAGLAGCYPLGPGVVEEFAPPNFIPNNPLFGISDGSTIQLTVEWADG